MVLLIALYRPQNCWGRLGHGTVGWRSRPEVPKRHSCFNAATQFCSQVGNQVRDDEYPPRLARCLARKKCGQAGARRHPHLDSTRAGSGLPFWRSTCCQAACSVSHCRLRWPPPESFQARTGSDPPVHQECVSTDMVRKIAQREAGVSSGGPRESFFTAPSSNRVPILGFHFGVARQRNQRTQVFSVVGLKAFLARRAGEHDQLTAALCLDSVLADKQRHARRTMLLALRRLGRMGGHSALYSPIDHQPA